ncbi:hypothetical protein Landi51_04740 [Colletotrichum acutatum]
MADAPRSIAENPATRVSGVGLGNIMKAPVILRGDRFCAVQLRLRGAKLDAALQDYGLKLTRVGSIPIASELLWFHGTSIPSISHSNHQVHAAKLGRLTREIVDSHVLLLQLGYAVHRRRLRALTILNVDDRAVWGRGTPQFRAILAGEAAKS